MEIDAVKRRQLWPGLGQNPSAQAGSIAIGQILEFVQGVVIDRFEYGIEDRLNITEVDRPSHHYIQWCFQVQSQGVGVTMDTAPW